MPKTQRAFAFRGFDPKRILQRPPFRQFSFDEGATDEEILQSLKAADSDSIDELETKLRLTKEIHETLDRYQNFISRHYRRLDELQKKTQRQAPIIDYVTAQLRTCDLMDKLRDIYYELEKEIQARYRAEFAARLKKLRKTAGLTQRQLGDMIQISPTGYALYEQGRRDPSIPTIIRIAKALNVDDNQLLSIT